HPPAPTGDARLYVHPRPSPHGRTVGLRRHGPPIRAHRFRAKGGQYVRVAHTSLLDAVAFLGESAAATKMAAISLEPAHRYAFPTIQAPAQWPANRNPPTSPSVPPAA